MKHENEAEPMETAGSNRTKLNYNKLSTLNTCWQVTVRIHELKG